MHEGIDYKAAMEKMRKVYAQIGHYLYSARKARGLTIDDVAEIGGVSPTTVLRVEHGDRDVRISTLCIICESLEIHLSDVLLFGVTDDGSECYQCKLSRFESERQGQGNS